MLRAPQAKPNPSSVYGGGVAKGDGGGATERAPSPEALLKNQDQLPDHHERNRL